MKKLRKLVPFIFSLSIGCHMQTSDNIHRGNTRELSFEVMRVEGGWGYLIKEGDRNIITQPFIPGIEGRHPFTDSIKAALTAQFVIAKIKRNIMPPSISARELDSLGALP